MLSRNILQIGRNYDPIRSALKTCETFPEAIRKGYTSISGKIDAVYHSVFLKTRLEASAGMVIGVHPLNMEFYAFLASLPPERDVRFIADSGMLSYLVEIERHVFPVARPSDSGDPQVTRLTQKIKNTIFEKQRYSQREAAKLNSKAIQNATNHINDGQIVLITPDGYNPGNSFHPWKTGVGRIICNARKGDALVIGVFMQPFSSLSDKIKFILNRGLVKNRIRVHFFDIGRFDLLKNGSKNPVKTTAKIQSVYRDTVRSLGFS
jgi:hypothetical protein